MKNIKIGKIIRKSSDKTIVVEVIRLKTHPKYKKKYQKSKCFHVHDKNNIHQVGEVIKILSSKPISKLKRWTVLENK